MPSINLDLDYFEHPKTRRLIRRLGDGAELLPLKLWIYVGKYHAEDGLLAGYSEQEIESIIQWRGQPGQAVAALRDAQIGFLEGTPDGFKVHDWLAHSGHIAAFKKRGQDAAEARWSKARDALGNATSITSSNACSNASSNALTLRYGTSVTGKAVPFKRSAETTTPPAAETGNALAEGALNRMIVEARDVFGNDWPKESKIMITLMGQQPGKFRRVLEDLVAAIKEQRVKKTKGAYFMEAWKRFR